jgi:hypothetical protein
MGTEFEVNGVRYKERPRRNPSRSAMRFLTISAMLGGGFEYLSDNNVRDNSGSKINLIEEYGLIQLKQSKLSARKRDIVVYNFEMLYEKIS